MSDPIVDIGYLGKVPCLGEAWSKTLQNGCKLAARLQKNAAILRLKECVLISRLSRHMIHSTLHYMRDKQGDFSINLSPQDLLSDKTLMLLEHEICQLNDPSGMHGCVDRLRCRKSLRQAPASQPAK